MDPATHPLFQPRPDAGGALLVVVTSDRGLAGAFNTTAANPGNFGVTLGTPAGHVRARRFYEREGWHDAGHIAYAAQVDGGVVTTKLKGVATQPLELRHAFAGGSAGVKEAAPVDIVLRVDGEEKAKTQRVRKAGFDSVRLEPAAAGKPGDLELQVRASHTGVAHFCWQLARADAAKKPVAALPNGVVPGAPNKSATPDVKAASAAAPADKAAADEKQEAKPAAADKASVESKSERGKGIRATKLPNGKTLTTLKPVVPLKPLRKAPASTD